MSYDNDFYKDYANYLVEPGVRKAHDFIFGLLSDIHAFEYVIDLGCGRFNEFYVYYQPSLYYTGMDQLATPSMSAHREIVQGSYRDKEAYVKAYQEETAFVSLFSSEITAPYKENYELYNWLFNTFPYLEAGLVSGFYYTDKKDKNPVEEAGGVISYQTLENVEDCNRDGYNETRILLPVPSKLFGPNVVEVWKVFTR